MRNSKLQGSYMWAALRRDTFRVFEDEMYSPTEHR